ncbi:NEW3 domain-containing protein [Desulfovirgula thermocuniculi]|uniref:COG1470 family protein n=1 Tax=Desulfovirgula thermocuniculi TaxID=348842 RepID=UPI000409E66D|nr:NEW3 domain-containing protein [Desulfovirgula thermocuniculi]
MVRQGIMAAALALLLCFLFAGPLLPAAVAGDGLLLYTPFTGIEVRPGETVAFPLELRSTAPRKVDLLVVSAPQGWPASFRGGGMIVNQVFAGGDPVKLEFQVEVPQGAQPGTYRFTVKASATDASSTLPLQLVIKETPSGGDRMTTQYPVLTGTATTTFRFRVDLTNSGVQERSYSLNAQAPPGWQVTFSPAFEDKQIASISLKPGQSQGLDVTIKPPQGVTAGTYEIPVEAVSSFSKAGTVLKVVIAGAYSLEITTPTERLNAEAVAGAESPLTIIVKNTGTSDIQGVTFSATAPANWAVTFNPEKIDVLAAGESRQVVAYIKPAREAIAGDYVVSIRASSPVASTAANFRVTVKTSTLWGIVGLLMVLAVVGGVAWLFYRYGRR